MKCLVCGFKYGRVVEGHRMTVNGITYNIPRAKGVYCDNCNETTFDSENARLILGIKKSSKDIESNEK